MKANTFVLDVDIKQDNYINEPVIKQNDSVVFIINLTDSGGPVDLTGVTRNTIATERGDGVGVIADGKKTGDSQVTFNLPRESTTRTGRATHTVQLYSADERVSSFTFPMMVEKDPSASLIVTGGDKTLIEIVLGEGPRVIQEAKDATITANDAATLAGTKGDYAQEQGDYAKAEGAKATSSASAADIATGKANTAAIDADAAKDRANTSSDAADVATGKANTAAANADASAGRADTSASKADTAATGLDIIKADTVAATGDALAAAELANTESSGLATMKADVVAATASATNASTQATTQADYAKTQGDYAKAQGDAVQEIFDSGLVASVNGQTGAVVITSEEIADTPSKRFVTDVKTAEWDAKETPENSQAKVDALAGTKSKPNGIASLGPDGKVPAAELPKIANTGNDVTITDVGEIFTATNVEDALQEVMAKTNQAFTQASDGKQAIADVTGAPASMADTFAQLKTHIQNAKATGATNLAAKGVSVSPTEPLNALMEKIADVERGTLLPKKAFFPFVHSPQQSGGSAIATGYILGATSKYLISSSGGNSLYIVRAAPGEPVRLERTINLADSIIANWGGLPVADRYVLFYTLSSGTYYLNRIDLESPTFKTEYVQGWSPTYVQGLTINVTTRAACPSVVGDYSFITSPMHLHKINSVGELAWSVSISSTSGNHTILGELDGRVYVNSRTYLQVVNVETGILEKSLPRIPGDFVSAYFDLSTRNCLTYTGNSAIIYDFTDPPVGTPQLRVMSWVNMCIPDPAVSGGMIVAFTDTSNAPSAYRKKVMAYPQDFATVNSFTGFQIADAVPRSLRDTSRQRNSYLAEYLAFGTGTETGGAYEIILMEG